MSLEVRPARDKAEFGRALYAIAQHAFGAVDEVQLDRYLQVIELERMYAAVDDGKIAGGLGAFGFKLSVPGGIVPCAGLTLAGVYPTHRRRGVMQTLMSAQLQEAHQRGEPIAASWALEETLLGRWGYGLASWSQELRLKREWAGFAGPLQRRGHTRFVEPAEAMQLFPPVWEALSAERSGVFSRSRAWWEMRTLHQQPSPCPKRFVALELDGKTAAYAIYRQFPGWDDGVAAGRLEVLEALGTSPQATAEIWRFLLDIDLVATIEIANLPMDHPLFLLLANPRRAGVRRRDALWIRLVDVGAALSGRAYPEGSLVFEIRDTVCPWNAGRWRLADGACAPTDRDPDLAMDVAALSSAFLGAISFAELHRALRLDELRGGAVADADRLFGWRPLPWCPEIF